MGRLRHPSIEAPPSSSVRSTETGQELLVALNDKKKCSRVVEAIRGGNYTRYRPIEARIISDLTYDRTRQLGKRVQGGISKQMPFLKENEYISGPATRYVAILLDITCFSCASHLFRLFLIFMNSEIRPGGFHAFVDLFIIVLVERL